MFTANGEFWREKNNITLVDGFYFSNRMVRNPSNKMNASDLPLTEYGETSVSAGFVEAMLERVNLKLVAHIPQGHVGVQDIFIARH